MNAGRFVVETAVSIFFLLNHTTNFDDILPINSWMRSKYLLHNHALSPNDTASYDMNFVEINSVPK